MAYVYTWDPTNPELTDLVRDGAAEIREGVKGALNERLLTVFTNLTADPLVHSKVLLQATGKMNLDGLAAGDTYISENSANRIALVVGGVEALAMVATQVAVGAACDLTIGAAKRFYIDGGSDTYIAEIVANNISFVAAGAEYVRIHSAGHVGILPTAALYFDGLTAGGDTYIVESAANQMDFYVGATINLRLTPTLKQFFDNLAIPPTNRFYLDGGGDSYVYEPSANRLDFIVGGLNALILAATFLAIQPANKFYFDGGSDTYIQEIAANVLSFVVGTVTAFQVAATFTLSPVDFIISATKKVRLDGAAAGDTYIAESSANIISFTAGGTIAATITATSLTVTGSLVMNSLQKLYLDGGGDTYISEAVANQMSMFTNNIESMRLDQTGLAATNTSLNLSTFIGGVTTLTRVVLGANDSAGVGFRIMRVVNN